MTDSTGSSGDATATARDQATELKDHATEQAREVTGRTRAEAQSVAEDARDQARKLVDETRSELHDQADSQTSRAAERLGQVAHELEQMAKAADDDGGILGSVTREAAAMTQRTSQRLQEGGVDGMVGDVKRFARNRPGAFLLGALGAGLVVGRLVRNVDTDSVTGGADSQPDSNGHGAAPGSAGASVPSADVPPVGVAPPTGVSAPVTPVAPVPPPTAPPAAGVPPIPTPGSGRPR